MNRSANRRLAAVLALIGLLPVAREAGAQEFILPIACTPGQDCVIQNYVDQDPGPGWQDYRCGNLSYDGHKGTDFRVRNLRDLARGVPVVAAADGVVKALRDGMADRMGGAETQDMAGRDCGNGVILTHGNGWETQYCHVRNGSVLVERGQKVRQGETLALVGLSGRTEFPHVHFEVRWNEQVVDPFVASAPPQPCQPPQSAYWQADAAAQLPYRPVTLFGAGFTSSKPSLKAVEQGALNPQVQRSPKGPLILWTRLVGYRPEHELHMRIVDPHGQVLRDDRLDPVDRPKAQWLTWIGVRPGPDGWAPGSYVGEITVTQAGRVLARGSVTTEMP